MHLQFIALYMLLQKDSAFSILNNQSSCLFLAQLAFFFFYQLSLFKSKTSPLKPLHYFTYFKKFSLLKEGWKIRRVFSYKLIPKSISIRKYSNFWVWPEFSRFSLTCRNLIKNWHTNDWHTQMKWTLFSGYTIRS